MISLHLLISCSFLTQLWIHSQCISLSGDIKVNSKPKWDINQGFSVCHWNLKSVASHNFIRNSVFNSLQLHTQIWHNLPLWILFELKNLLNCVRTVMVYGSKVWPLKESHSRISWSDMQMVKWMCNVSFRDWKSFAELRDRLGLANVIDVSCQTRLRRLDMLKE